MIDEHHIGVDAAFFDDVDAAFGSSEFVSVRVLDENGSWYSFAISICSKNMRSSVGVIIESNFANGNDTFFLGILAYELKDIFVETIVVSFFGV